MLDCWFFVTQPAVFLHDNLSSSCSRQDGLWKILSWLAQQIQISSYSSSHQKRTEKKTCSNVNLHHMCITLDSKAERHSCSQKITHLLQNSKFQDCVRQRLPMGLNLCKLNQCTYPLCSRFILIFSNFCLGPWSCFFPSSFPTKILFASHPSRVCYVHFSLPISTTMCHPS